MNATKKQTILLGLTASLLFSVTFILNRLMSIEGGNWIWSSSLRFYWMLPFFGAIVWYLGGFKALFHVLNSRSHSWHKNKSYRLCLRGGCGEK